MKSMILSVMLFFSLCGASFAQTQYAVNAFCLETETVGLQSVRTAFETDNEPLFVAQMTFKEIGCIDLRMAGLPPISGVKIRTIGDPFFTPKGVCVQFMIFQDTRGNRAVTWTKCEGTPI